MASQLQLWRRFTVVLAVIMPASGCPVDDLELKSRCVSAEIRQPIAP